MKSKLFIFLSFILFCFYKSQVVNIPDANFKSYLVNDSTINTNADSEIQLTEATSYTGSINCPNRTIYDITGIEAFTNITSINVGFNKLTSLDVSNNTAIIGLYCFGNQITALNVNNNTALQYLYCFTNQITSLDVSHNLALKELSCFENQIMSLDVTNNLALQNLNCSSNQISTLDVSKNTLLKNLSCDTNHLTTLDVSNNNSLVALTCSNNQISNLDVTKSLLLQKIDCYFNNITTLDLSKNTALEFLSCGRNFISSLDVTNNILLKNLYCFVNPIPYLDLSKNIALQTLDCRGCIFTSLDLSKNTALTFLWSYACSALENLNLKNGNNAILTTMYAFSDSRLKCIDVDDISLADSYVNATYWQKDNTTIFSTNCSTLSVSDGNKNIFKFYPNPTENLVNFSLNANVQVYNFLGQKIIEKKEVSFIDLSNYSDGMYLIILSDKNGKEISRNKIIKK